MKESMWGYWIVVLGISVISVMVLLQNFTTTSEQDYYLVKSCLEASMYDAVDYGYYRDTSILKMNAEKFYENFIRRFAQTVNINKGYKINFYDVYEIPPAASVSVTTSTDETNYGQDAGATQESAVTNRLTGILFTNENYKPKKTVSGAPLTDNLPAAKGELYTGDRQSANGIWIASYKKGEIVDCVLNDTTGVRNLFVNDLHEKTGIIDFDNKQFRIFTPLIDCFTPSEKKVKVEYCYDYNESTKKCDGYKGSINLDAGGLKQFGYTS